MKIKGLKIYISKKIFWIFTFLVALTIVLSPYLFDQSFAQTVNTSGRQFPVMVANGTLKTAIPADFIYAWFTDGFLGYPAGNDPTQTSIEQGIGPVLSKIKGQTGNKMFMVSDKDTLAKVLNGSSEKGQEVAGHCNQLWEAGIRFIGYDMEISPPGTEREEMNSRQNTDSNNAVAIAAALAKSCHSADGGMKLIWGSIFANTVDINDDAMKVMLKAGLWGIAFQAQNQWDNPNGNAASQITAAVDRYRKDAAAVGVSAPHITVQVMTDGTNCISGQGTVPMASCQGLVQGLIKAGYLNSLSIWAQGATITEAFIKQILEGYYNTTAPNTGNSAGGGGDSGNGSGSGNGNGNTASASNTATTTDTSSEPTVNPPDDNIAINGGLPTISCKLGVSTEKTFPADNFTTKKAEQLIDRGLNPGWVMTGIDNSALASLSNGIMIKKLADNGTNIILIPCPLADTCDIKDGKAYADALWNIATKVGKPFWAKGSRSFPKSGYENDTPKEAEFISDLLKELKVKMKEQTDSSGDIATSYKFRGYINLLTPELTYKSPFHTDKITPDEYISKLLSQKDAVIDMGEFKGMLFDVIDPESMAKAIKLGKRYNLQIYALVGMIDDTTGAITDEQSKLMQQLLINQFINRTNVAAIIVQNGYTLGENQERKEPVDSYTLWKKLGNGDTTRYPWNSSSNHTCDYLKNRPDPKNPNSTLSEQDCGETAILGDRMEPTSVNRDIPYFYESQIISMLDAAGCSNNFQLQCTNENNLREKETGDLIFLSNDKSIPLRRIYDETKLATISPTLTTKVTGYVDFPDKTIETKDYTFTYCTNVPCTPNNQIVEIWTNVVSDVIFKTSILTTAEVNFPQLRSLASLDANGTDDANFPSFPALANRAGTTSGLINDYGRVADGEVYFSYPGGKKMAFPIPLLGSTIDLFSLDQSNAKLTNPFQTPNTKLTYVIDPYRIEKIKIFKPETYISKFIDSKPSFMLNGKAVPFTTKAERPQIVDENFATLGLAQYPANGLMTLNRVNTSTRSYPNGSDEFDKEVKDTKQFNASEVTTGEGSIQVNDQDEAGLKQISLLTYASTSPSVDGIASDNINWAVDQLNGKNCSDSQVPKATHTINGRPQIHSGEMPAFHLGKVGAGVACNDFPKRILSSNETVIPTGSTNAGDLGYKMFGNVSDPASIEFHPLMRATMNATAVSGVSGALKILRSAWLFSQRFHAEIVNNLNVAKPGEELQICHNMEIDTTLTTYNRFYSISSKIADTFPKPISVDSVKADNKTFYCMNPKNEARSGMKLPIIFAAGDTEHAALASSILPWFGTAQAIFEDVSKRQFNQSTNRPAKCNESAHALDSDCLEIPRCGPGAEKSVTCLCKPSEVQYKKFETFLCQNGMMDYSEMVAQNLIHPEFQKDAPEKFNPQGCLFVFNNKNTPTSTSGNGGTTTPTTPVTPGYTYGDGNKFMGVYGWRKMQTASSQGKVDLVTNFINSFGNLVDSDKSKIIGVLNVNIGTTTGNSCPFTTAGVGTMSVATAQALATLAAAKHYIIMFDIQPGTCTSDTIKNVMRTYYVNNNINFDFDLEWVSSISMTQLNNYVDFYYNSLKGAVPFIGIYYFSPNHLKVDGAQPSPHLATINDGIGSCAAKETSILAQLKNFGKSVTSPDKPGLWGGMDFSVGGYDSCKPAELFPWIIKNGGTIFMSQQ